MLSIEREPRYVNFAGAGEDSGRDKEEVSGVGDDHVCVVGGVETLVGTGGWDSCHEVSKPAFRSRACRS